MEFLLEQARPWTFPLPVTILSQTWLQDSEHIGLISIFYTLCLHIIKLQFQLLESKKKLLQQIIPRRISNIETREI